jgi:hypothetical protein
MNCDAALFLWGILVFSMSLLLLAPRLLAWRGSKRYLGGRRVDVTSRFENRALGIAIGVSFFVFGGVLTARQIACGSYAQLPATLNLAWTWWPGIWLAIAIGIAVGIANARRMPPITGGITFVLSVLFGVAVGQAPGFHTGVYASHWCVIALACLVLAAIVNALTPGESKLRAVSSSD